VKTHRRSGVRGAGVAFEAELADASAKEPEANELSAVRSSYARSFHFLADDRAGWALRCIDALVEDDLADDAARGWRWVATPQQEGPGQEQSAQGVDSFRHAQKSNAYG
jgi:hypothetical protein